jgi:hypothetical protein
MIIMIVWKKKILLDYCHDLLVQYDVVENFKETKQKKKGID